MVISSRIVKNIVLNLCSILPPSVFVMHASAHQFKEFSGGDDAASDLFRSEREQQAELQRRAEADRISAVPGLQCVLIYPLISLAPV